MRHLRPMVLGVAMAVALLACDGGLPRPPDTISWLSYSEALAQAASRDRMVLVYIHAKWCGYCRRLNRVLADGRIQAYLNDHFLAAHVDFDREKQIVSQFGTQAVPELWFLGADGQRLKKASGYVDAETLYRILQYMHHGDYRQMSFNQYLKRKG